MRSTHRAPPQDRHCRFLRRLRKPRSNTSDFQPVRSTKNAVADMHQRNHSRRTSESPTRKRGECGSTVLDGFALRNRLAAFGLLPVRKADWQPQGLQRRLSPRAEATLNEKGPPMIRDVRPCFRVEGVLDPKAFASTEGGLSPDALLRREEVASPVPGWSAGLPGPQVLHRFLCIEWFVPD